jgi:hypothetical protein
MLPDLAAFFAPRPLLPGGDENTYDGLLAHAMATTQPADAIEMMWARNAVDPGGTGSEGIRCHALFDPIQTTMNEKVCPVPNCNGADHRS